MGSCCKPKSKCGEPAKKKENPGECAPAQSQECKDEVKEQPCCETAKAKKDCCES